MENLVKLLSSHNEEDLLLFGEIMSIMTISQIKEILEPYKEKNKRGHQNSLIYVERMLGGVNFWKSWRIKSTEYYLCLGNHDVWVSSRFCGHSHLIN